jgi:hypothetical protein
MDTLISGVNVFSVARRTNGILLSYFYALDLQYGMTCIASDPHLCMSIEVSHETPWCDSDISSDSFRIEC